MTSNMDCLPIDIDNGLHLDLLVARAYGEKFSGEYCFAEPYSFIVIDNFLPEVLANDILSNFPVENLSDDKFYESRYSGLHKRRNLPMS